MVPSVGEKQHCGKKGKGIYLLVAGMTVVHLGTHRDPGPSCDLSGGHAMTEIKTPVLAADAPHLQCVIAV